MLAIRTLCRLRSDKRGATVIEYGLIVSLIVVAIMGALSALAAAPTACGASSIVSFELDVASCDVIRRRRS